jgi:hypothetical protein
VLRALILILVLAAAGLGAARLFSQAPAPGPPAPRPATPGAPAAGGAATGGIASPFGDALFRWRCTTGLRAALGPRPDWPLRRVARFCLCAADELRAGTPRQLVVGSGDLAAALATAEARYCRPE